MHIYRISGYAHYVQLCQAVCADLMLLVGQVLGEIDSKQLGQGFRAPGLIRFVSQDSGYLSPTSDGPRMFVNLEDYLSRTTGTPNTQFQVTVSPGLWTCPALHHHPELDVW